MMKSNKAYLLILSVIALIFFSSLVNASWLNSSGDNQNKDYLTIDLEAGYNFESSSLIDTVTGINNGTDSGGSYANNGFINNSAYLSGNPNYLAFPAFHLADPSSIAYSFWVNWSSGGDGIVERLWSSQSEFDEYIAESDGKITFIPRVGESWITTNPVIKDNWTHIVYSCDVADKNQTVYINGVFDSSVINSYGCPVMVTDLKFGVLYTTTNRFYKGWVDEAYFWNRTLNKTEVSDLYNSGKGLTYSTSAPPVITWYKPATNGVFTNQNPYNLIINISDPYLDAVNLTVYNFTANCYQETANVSTSCGGLDTGNYLAGGLVENWISLPNIYDGNWNSRGWWTGGGIEYIYINYSKPINSIGAIWQVSDGQSGSSNIVNLTIPQSCFNYYPQTLVLSAGAEDAEGSNWTCYNGTWVVLRNTPTEFSLYEESITWNIRTGWYNNFTENITATALQILDSIPLAEGINTVEVCARDSELNSICENKNIILDTIYPIPNITYPLLTNYYSQLEDKINWTLIETNPNNCWIEYNNINSSVNCLDYNAGWTYLLGNNTITIYANDSAGNINKSTLIFTVIDDVPPNITLVSPLNNSLINESFNINLTAIVQDFFGVDNATVTVYNETGSLYNQTTVTLSGIVQTTVGIVITFIEGIYKWAYAATHSSSPALTTFSENNTLYVDNTYPELILISPQNNTGFSANNFTINVTAYDLTEQRISFRLYNMSGYLLNESNYSDSRRTQTFSNLSEGNYLFKVDIIDALNYTNSTGLIYVYTDYTFPQETVNILNNTYTNQSVINFTLNATDALQTIMNYSQLAWLDNNGQDQHLDSLSTQLAAYYKFEETSGTKIIDSYKGKYNGTNTAATVNVNGLINKAYKLNWLDSANLYFPKSSITGPFSTSFWFKWSKETGDNTDPRLFSSNKYMDWQIETATNDIYIMKGFNDNFLLNTKATNGTWMHMVVTYNGTEVRAYFNGVLDANTPQPSTMIGGDLTDLYFGSYYKYSYRLYGGLVDEMGWWNRTLTASEVAELYNSGNGLTLGGKEVAVPDSTLGHLSNITFTIKNGSNILSQNTTIFSNEPKNAFVSFVYDLWYEGPYKWFWTVADSVNHVVSSEEKTFTYDATYPTITITSPSNNTGFNTTSFTVNVTAYDTNERVIDFRLYNLSGSIVQDYNYTNQTRSQTFSNLDESNYLFEVIIKDQLNQTNTTGIYYVYTDYTAPQGSNIAPLNNTYTNIATHNFTVNATDELRTITAWTSNNQDANANYLTTGLKAYYKLEDTGENVLDSYLGRYNGTNTTLQKRQPGIVNYAYNFSNQGYIEIGDGIYSDEGEVPNANYTFAFWIYPTYNATYRWIIGSDYNQVYMIDGQLHFPTPSAEPTTVSTIPLYTWTYVVFTCSAYPGYQNKSIYINGVIDYSGYYYDGCFYSGTRAYRLGSTISGGAYWYGKMDEVAFWNRTLNNSEVAKLYNNGNGITWGTTSTTDSTLGHLSNLTFIMKNGTNSIINQTDINLPAQPKFTFLGVVYEFVTEGIYNWFYRITDAIGFTTNTTEAKITYDITLPNLIIAFPTAINYTAIPTTLNYTYTELYPSSCWYSTNGGITNISITCGNNATGLNPPQGTNTWMIAMNDSTGNQNATFVTFFLDSINPTINFTDPTDIDEDYVPRRNIIINVTSFDTNFANVTVYVYNSSSGLVNATTTLTSPNYQNISVPDDGTYYINATAYDIYGNFNYTETRSIFVDTTGLFIYLNTPANGTYMPYNTTNLTVNLSDATFGVANTTLYVYNTTGPVNVTTATFPLGVLQTTFGIVVILADNVYKWWYDAFDFASNYLSSPINHTLIIDTTPPTYTYLIANSDGNNSYINRSYIIYNVTAYDLYLRNVTIRLYDSGLVLNQSTLNTTINSNASFSGIFSGLTNGDWNLQAEACDIVNNCLNSSINLIHVDIINPRINFTDPTLFRNNLTTAYDLTAIWGNFTAIDIYPKNASMTLVGPLGYTNTTHWDFNQTTQSFFFNYTHLIDGTYNLSARVYDMANRLNQTETRTIYITGNAPINMSYEYPTPLVGGTSLLYLPINISVNEPNIRNITINIFYANHSLLSSVNSSSYVQNFYNEFSIPDGFVYLFNATAYDIYGHKTDLPTYQVQMEYGTGNASVCKLLPLSGTYTLIKDLNKSNGICLEVGAPNVVIDCAGHSIIVGEGSPIYTNKNNVLIKNCILDNIGPALNITGGSVTAINCTFQDSTFGIWLNGGMVTVTDSIFDNNDYGIYLTGRAVANVINESGFINSTGYRLTKFNTAWNFRDVTINTVTNTSNLSQTSIIDAGNYIYANGYITNASDANYNNVKISYTYAYDVPNTKAVFNNVRFTDNTYGIYHNYTAIIPGGASGSVVWGPSGAGNYNNITFTGTTTGLITLMKSSYNKFVAFTSSTGGAVSYTNSSYNLFDDSTLTGTTVTLAASSTDNTFHDTTYSSESVDASSKLIRTWTTKVITKDTQGDKVGGVTVHINDGTNTTTGTAPSGEVTVDIIQYINNGTVTTHNPYEVFGVLINDGSSLFTDIQTATITSPDTEVTLTFAQQVRSTLLTRQVGFILMAILLLIGLAASTGFFIVKMRNGESVADIWKYFIIMMIWNTIFLILFLVLGRYIMAYFYP